MNETEFSKYIDLLFKDNDISVYLAKLNIKSPDLKNLQDTLTSSELEQVSKYNSFNQRSLFVARRGLLKYILSKYICKKPKEIEFSYTKIGKPYLKNFDISFNSSSSSEAAVFCISNSCEVGIDIEKVQDFCLTKDFINQIYTKNEQVILSKLDLEQRPLNFLKGWVQKEAISKLFAVGLTSSLRNYEVLYLNKADRNVFQTNLYNGFNVNILDLKIESKNTTEYVSSVAWYSRNKNAD